MQFVNPNIGVLSVTCLIAIILLAVGPVFATQGERDMPWSGSSSSRKKEEGGEESSRRERARVLSDQ